MKRKELSFILDLKDKLRSENKIAHIHLHGVFDWKKAYHKFDEKNEDDFCWINKDGEEIDTQMLIDEFIEEVRKGTFSVKGIMTKYVFESLASLKGYKKVGWTIYRELITVFLSQKGAEEFILKNRNNYNDLHIVKLKSNEELKNIRKFIYNYGEEF